MVQCLSLYQLQVKYPLATKAVEVSVAKILCSFQLQFVLLELLDETWAADIDEKCVDKRILFPQLLVPKLVETVGTIIYWPTVFCATRAGAEKQ